MPTVALQGTTLTVSVLPAEKKEVFWTDTEIVIQNEYLKYADRGKRISREEMEGWLSAAYRLLAGGYEKAHSLAFECAGLAVDLYPPTENGLPVSREERRNRDCVMALRLLMRSRDGNLLGGVYTLLLHREEIARFADGLSEEYERAFAKHKPRKGKYLFAGVSPLGYKGCNYWYYDPTGKTKKGDFVWVVMGRHKREQIVLVDSVRFYNDDDAPYNPATVKKVLRKAKKEEMGQV